VDATAGSLLGVAFGLLAGAGGVLVFRSAGAGQPAPPEDSRSLPPGVSSVLDALGSGSLVLDREEQVVFATPAARSWGLVRGESLVNEDVIRVVRQVWTDGAVCTLDIEPRRVRRAPRLLLSIRVAPLTADLVVVVAEDRTEAARVDDVRRDFVANVSHELKTPVGALSLLAEAVENAADDPEAVIRFAGRMQHEATRLTSMVTELIELSRLQGDDVRNHAGAVSVDDVVSDACDFVRTAALAKNIELRQVGRPDLFVHGVREQLVMALRNLLDNAVNYSAERTQVVIEARVVDPNEAEGADREYGEPDMVEISVSDQGIGISGPDQMRIFERFYRVDPARSRETGGTGLGLAIVKHVCVNHGGEVSVWSIEGAGSTFTLRLPMSAPDGVLADDGAAGAPAAATEGARNGRAPQAVPTPAPRVRKAVP
jgi:two-component system, OmpR family, sensor histidine kinase SenX3